MSKFHSLPVIALKQESTDTTSITLGISEELKSAFSFKAGQYLTLRLQINGEEVRRSYSMSSAPSAKDLTFTVKKVAGGKASTFLNQQTKVGDQIEVMRPEGRFTAVANPDIGQSYYFFAGGSGITPIMSMIRTLLDQEPLSTLHLLYASRDEENIIFNSELQSLEERHKDQLIIDHVLSQPKTTKAKGLGGFFKKAITTWSGKSGRITTSMVENFLQDNPLRGETAAYYLCGPAGFMDTVQNSLETLQIDKAQIHTEFFTSADVPKSAEASTGGAVVSATLQYVLEKKESSITVPVGKTILEALLDEKIDAPFSCQSGACSTCMCKVETGSANMDTCLALDDEEVADGFILACQARPTSENIKINFDI